MGLFYGRIDVGRDSFNDLFDQAGSRRRRKLQRLFEEIGFANEIRLSETAA